MRIIVSKYDTFNLKYIKIFFNSSLSNFGNTKNYVNKSHKVYLILI